MSIETFTINGESYVRPVDPPMDTEIIKTHWSTLAKAVQTAQRKAAKLSGDGTEEEHEAFRAWQRAIAVYRHATRPSNVLLWCVLHQEEIPPAAKAQIDGLRAEVKKWEDNARTWERYAEAADDKLEQLRHRSLWARVVAWWKGQA